MTEEEKAILFDCPYCVRLWKQFAKECRKGIPNFDLDFTKCERNYESR